MRWPERSLALPASNAFKATGESPRSCEDWGLGGHRGMGRCDAMAGGSKKDPVREVSGVRSRGISEEAGDGNVLFRAGYSLEERLLRELQRQVVA
jgi:hypothetical protein